MRVFFLTLLPLAACVTTTNGSWTGSEELMKSYQQNSARCEVFAEGSMPLPTPSANSGSVIVTDNYGGRYHATYGNSLQSGMTDLGSAIAYRTRINKRYRQCMTILGYSENAES